MELFENRLQDNSSSLTMEHWRMETKNSNFEQL